MEKFLDSLLHLSLVLIGIVPLIYVLTVSLLGRAIKKQKEEQESHSKIRDEELEIELGNENKIYQEILKTKDQAKIKQAKDDLDKIIKRNEASKEERIKIGKKYGKLSIQGSIIPFFWFVLSFVTVLIAQGLLMNQVVTIRAIWVIYGLFTIAVIFIIIGLIKQYQIMRVIQEVAYPAEEALMQMTVDAFKQALTEHDELTKPLLMLFFSPQKPPFTVPHSTNYTIKFKVRLERGDIAYNSLVSFYAPPAFDFITHKITVIQSNGFLIPNAITAEVQTRSPLLKKNNYEYDIEIKTPDQPGQYKLIYRLECEKFTGEFVPLFINVT
jgi:ABC-type multidrug transport system fused ATPase/permease subunit